MCERERREREGGREKRRARTMGRVRGCAKAERREGGKQYGCGGGFAGAGRRGDRESVG